MTSAGNDHNGNGAQPGDAPPLTAAVIPGAEASGRRGGNVDDADQPATAAAAFVKAVAWGEHLRVWELFSIEARRLVLRVAVTRGMDEQLSARLRDGVAGSAERDIFLADLVNGLRADLRGADIDSLLFDPDPIPGPPDPNRARITLMAPVVNPILGAPLPVASMELVRERGQWRVEHLLPQAKK
jgi:hypothetical protein